MIYDFCVVGGGIVGLATAMELQRRQPGASLVLVEKEDAVGQHQTGHNSGVIHAGIYYEPTSLKAQFCREGIDATKAFCEANDVPHESCGKLIVATNDVEQKRIDNLYERAVRNGVSIERIDGDQLSEMEPNITGISALLSPTTGMVDFVQMSMKMADTIVAAGGEIRLGAKVTRIRENPGEVEIGVGDAAIQAKKLIVCGGLQADRLARMAGLDVDFRIVPFRGEYFRLPPAKNAIVKHHIYPAPNPLMPFLGVHLTRMIDGSVTVGPNAVVGFSREGYPKLSVNVGDVADYAVFAGFWKLIAGNMQHAFKELYGSFWKPGYLAECQKYCPSLELSDLLPYRAGIRAQAVLKNGEAAEDFLFKQSDRMLHVCNAPSPAATSAIPIGRAIADKVLAAA